MKRNFDFGLLVLALLPVLVAVGIFYIGKQHHAEHYTGRILEIQATDRGFIAKVILDHSGFLIPLTLKQADRVKVGDTVDFCLEFNGWGECLSTLEINPR